jgi:hypothetical protein
MENYFAAAVIFGLFVLTAAVGAERKDITVRRGVARPAAEDGCRRRWSAY